MDGRPDEEEIDAPGSVVFYHPLLVVGFPPAFLDLRIRQVLALPGAWSFVGNA